MRLRWGGWQNEHVALNVTRSTVVVNGYNVSRRSIEHHHDGGVVGEVAPEHGQRLGGPIAGRDGRMPQARKHWPKEFLLWEAAGTPSCRLQSLSKNCVDFWCFSRTSVKSASSGNRHR